MVNITIAVWMDCIAKATLEGIRIATWMIQGIVLVERTAHFALDSR